MLQRYRQQLGVGLFPLAALVVHQLRYQLAFGGDASRELAEQGHSYLHELTSWIVLAVAVGVGGLISWVARAWRSGEADGFRGRGLTYISGYGSADVGVMTGGPVEWLISR